MPPTKKIITSILNALAEDSMYPEVKDKYLRMIDTISSINKFPNITENINSMDISLSDYPYSPVVIQKTTVCEPYPQQELLDKYFGN